MSCLKRIPRGSLGLGIASAIMSVAVAAMGTGVTGAHMPRKVEHPNADLLNDC